MIDRWFSPQTCEIINGFLGPSVSRDSAIGIATRYGLDGPGIEILWGQDSSHPSKPALGPIQPPIQ